MNVTTFSSVQETELTQDGIYSLDLDSARKYAHLLVKIDMESNWDSWSEKNFLHELPGKFEFSFYVKCHQTIVGYAIVSKKTQSCLHIHRFVVSKDFQDLGIGNKMMQETIARGIKANINFLSLKVAVDNKKAIQFYDKFDFLPLDVHNGYLFEVMRILK